MKPVALFFNNMLVEILEHFDIFHISIKRSNEIPISVLAVTLMLLGVIFLLSAFWGRLYCNSVCPVGLILAKLSHFSFFKFRIDTQNCQACRLCEIVCKAGCISAENHTIDHSRCLACFNCQTACKKGLISYSRRIQPVETNPVWLKRQFLLNSVLAGGVLLSACTPFRMRRWGLLPKTMPVLPPGSLSIDHFTRTCTACHLCISACTTHVMKPTLTGYGLSGIMLPQLSFQKAHCDYECNACGNICPTGAIAPLSSETKKLTRIGKAVLNLDACVIHIKKNRCGACGEACPTHAISPRVENQLIFPQINSDYCIGCGACEHACPAKPKAILIKALSVQETAVKHTPIKRQNRKNDIQTSGFPF